MEKRKKIYEGKAKIIFTSDRPNCVIQYFKDDITAFNKEEFQVIDKKGIINNAVSSYLMHILNKENIKTHFLNQINEREQLVKKVEIIPLEVVVRNIASGSICKRLGIKKSTIFSRPIVEFYYKKDELNDPLVSEEHINYLDIVANDTLIDMKNMAKKINNILKKVFSNIYINLIDFKIEFGINSEGKLLLSDEISSDTCRLWDINSEKNFDKDIFRYTTKDPEKIINSYKEVSDRFGLSTI